jgi:hypothetical protein
MFEIKRTNQQLFTQVFISINEKCDILKFHKNNWDANSLMYKRCPLNQTMF